MKTVEQFLDSEEMMLVHKGTFFFLMNSLSMLMVHLGKPPAEMASETLTIFKRSRLPEAIYDEYHEYMQAVNHERKRFKEELEDE